MIKAEPLVSIIIPTYNRAHLIMESIHSVIDQTYSRWEAIVIDDGSTDNTKDVVMSIGDKRISYHYFKHTGVIDEFRNFGIQSAKGDLIAFLDSDDLWLPEKLTMQVNLLRKYPEAMFAFSHGYEFDDSGSMFHHNVFLHRNREYDDIFVGKLFQPLLEKAYMSYFPSLIFRREIVDEIGLMDETLKSCYGFEYFLRVASRFDGIAINTKLIRVRKHEGSTSVLREVISYDTSSAIILKYYKSGHLNKALYLTIISEFQYKAGLIQLKTGNKKKSLHYFRSYIFLKPFRLNGWVRIMQALVGNYTFKVS